MNIVSVLPPVSSSSSSPPSSSDLNDCLLGSPNFSASSSSSTSSTSSAVSSPSTSTVSSTSLLGKEDVVLLSSPLDSNKNSINASTASKHGAMGATDTDKKSLLVEAPAAAPSQSQPTLDNNGIMNVSGTHTEKNQKHPQETGDLLSGGTENGKGTGNDSSSSNNNTTTTTRTTTTMLRPTPVAQQFLFSATPVTSTVETMPTTTQLQQQEHHRPDDQDFSPRSSDDMMIMMMNGRRSRASSSAGTYSAADTDVPSVPGRWRSSSVTEGSTSTGHHSTRTTTATTTGSGSSEWRTKKKQFAAIANDFPGVDRSKLTTSASTANFNSSTHDAGGNKYSYNHQSLSHDLIDDDVEVCDVDLDDDPNKKKRHGYDDGDILVNEDEAFLGNKSDFNNSNRPRVSSGARFQWRRSSSTSPGAEAAVAAAMQVKEAFEANGGNYDDDYDDHDFATGLVVPLVAEAATPAAASMNHRRDVSPPPAQLSQRGASTSQRGASTSHRGVSTSQRGVYTSQRGAGEQTSHRGRSVSPVPPQHRQQQPEATTNQQQESSRNQLKKSKRWFSSFRRRSGAAMEAEAEKVKESLLQVQADYDDEDGDYSDHGRGGFGGLSPMHGGRPPYRDAVDDRFDMALDSRQHGGSLPVSGLAANRDNSHAAAAALSQQQQPQQLSHLQLNGSTHNQNRQRNNTLTNPNHSSRSDATTNSSSSESSISIVGARSKKSSVNGDHDDAREEKKDGDEDVFGNARRNNRGDAGGGNRRTSFFQRQQPPPPSSTSSSPAPPPPPTDKGKRGSSFFFTLKRMRSRARRNLGDESVSGLFEDCDGLDMNDTASANGVTDSSHGKALEKMKVSTHNNRANRWSDSISAVWSGLLAPDVVANQLIEPENGEGGLGEYRFVGLAEDEEEEEENKKFHRDNDKHGDEDDSDLQSVKLQTPHCSTATILAGNLHDSNNNFSGSADEGMDQMKVATEKTKDKVTWTESLTKVASVALAPELYAHEVMDSVADEQGRGAYRFVGNGEEDDDEEEDLSGAKKKDNLSLIEGVSVTDGTSAQDLISTLRHVVGRLRTQVRDLEGKLGESEHEKLMWKARVHELEAQVAVNAASTAKE